MFVFRWLIVVINFLFRRSKVYALKYGNRI